jgi:hypothetical protein
MFRRMTVSVNPNNELRDILTDIDTGVSIDAIHTSRELFIPTVHMNNYKDGFFVSFKVDPRDRYDGIYLIFKQTNFDYQCDMQDALNASIGY